MKALKIMVLTVLVGCASTGPTMMGSVHRGQTQWEVIDAIGKPDRATWDETEGGDIHFFYENRKDEAGLLGNTYVVLFRNKRVLYRGEEDALNTKLAMDFTNLTPHEVCGMPKYLGKYADLAECKVEIPKLQARIRSDIQAALEHDRIRQREAQAQRAAIIQAAAPMMMQTAGQAPQPMNFYQAPTPAYVTQPFRQPVNCMSVPNGFGGMRTSCQ